MESTSIGAMDTVAGPEISRLVMEFEQDYGDENGSRFQQSRKHSPRTFAPSSMSTMEEVVIHSERTLMTC